MISDVQTRPSELTVWFAALTKLKINFKKRFNRDNLHTYRLPVLKELGGVSECNAVVADTVVERSPSSFSLVDLVSDPARVQLRVLHHAISCRHKLTNSSLHAVGCLDERVERLSDHLN